MQDKIDFYTGCYSQALGDMAGNGEGICTVSLDLRTGAMSEPVCVAACINPSYLTWGPDQQTLYATREVVRPDTPALVSFTRTSDQQWHQANTAELPGECPCHISVDPSGKLLASAQYVSGDIAVFELAGDGKIGKLNRMIQHTGHGPNKARQEGPHAHYVAFQRDTLLTVDLGIDGVLVYGIHYQDLTVNDTPIAHAQTRAGSGPRHVARLENANTAYVLCELGEEISQLALEPGSAAVINTLPAFSNRVENAGAAAAIKISPDQRHLYASGRNQSVIACFAIDAATGKLTAIGETETGGTGPRDFSLSPDGEYLIAANQITNNLASFKRDTESGLLQATGHSIDTGSPVCVLF